MTINGKYGKPCWLPITIVAASSAKVERKTAGVAKMAHVESALQKARL